MKNKCNFYKIACGFLALIALISIGVFVLYWKDSHISFIMSDWGSFADYISGIPLSIITILFVIATYKEQKDSNKIIQFESSFFYLCSSVKIGDSKTSYKKIHYHFDNISDKLEINKNECILLLSNYWMLHKDKLDYRTLSTSLLYLIKTNLIEEKEKRHYLNILYSNISGEDYICFLAYLCHRFYIEKRTEFLCHNLSFHFTNLDEFQKQIVNILSSSENEVQLLNISVKEDYGFYLKEQETENYKQTLNRLLSEIKK